MEQARRWLGIAVLSAGLVGLMALGGAGWSLEAAFADGSSGSESIVVLEGSSIDLGANYRETGTAAGSATERTVTAGVADLNGIVDALVAPADKREDLRVGGLLYAHAISLVGAALVALDRLTARVLGFEGLLATSPAIYLGGFLIAVGIGTVGAVVAGWRAARYARVDHLQA